MGLADIAPYGLAALPDPELNAPNRRGRIIEALAGTWPAQMAKAAWEAAAVPGQVAGGELAVQPEVPGMWSDMDEARQQATQSTMMDRAADLAGLLMLGSSAVPAGANELRAGIRPYQNVPESLMGFRRGGQPGKSFDEQSYRHTQPVEVVLRPFFGRKPDIFRDAVKGLNPDHAVERAYRNWPDAWHIRGLD